jgi:hypothetical protein
MGRGKIERSLLPEVEIGSRLPGVGSDSLFCAHATDFAILK